MVVVDLRSSWSRVTLNEELVGRMSFVSRLPQYLMTAMLTGALQVASSIVEGGDGLVCDEKECVGGWVADVSAVTSVNPSVSIVERRGQRSRAATQSRKKRGTSLCHRSSPRTIKRRQGGMQGARRHVGEDGKRVVLSPSLTQTFHPTISITDLSSSRHSRSPRSCESQRSEASELPR